MAAQADKTIARLKQSIADGEFYEAQQQARSFALRSLRTKKYASAVSVTYTISQSLLQAGHGAAGADLSSVLIECYKTAETRCEGENRQRAIDLLQLIPEAEDPARRRYLGELVGWSAKFGEFPAGDPEIHHAAGVIYADESDPYTAEKHLVLGTTASPAVLAKLEYSWYESTGQPHAAHIYAARFLFPYLLMGNIAAASSALSTYISLLLNSSSPPPSEQLSSEVSASGLKIFPSLPLLNFLSLLLLSCQRMSADLYRQLKSHYRPWLDDPELLSSWDESLAQIGEMYFGIAIPRQSNPLMDMMGSLLGGGGGFGAPQRREQPARVSLKPVEAPPSEGLD